VAARRVLTAALLAALALGAQPAHAETTRTNTTATAATNPEAPVPVAASDTPPPGRHLSADQVLEIANRLPRMRRVRAEHRGSYGGAYLKGPLRWQVSYFTRQTRKQPSKEIGQVIIADSNGRVLEEWTGFQIAWTMARGYPGAFGRHVNALYIWIPLSVLFFAAFFDWRRPFRLLHLDLLVLLSFSISLAFFNHANIGLSVPLAYPPLLYLLARMLVLTRAFRRPRPGHQTPARAGIDGDAGATAAQAAPPHLRLLVPAPWLALAVMFLLGFRIALNVTDSNVIDVGYAGVIGAQRIVDGRALYGHYPSDNEHGDTYGPVDYEAYAPFQQIFGWSGQWDDLPAAHAAAIVFDLLAVALLFLLGRRARGPDLGIALAYAWVSYPFTLFTLESNSNDTLVGALVLAALLVACSPLRLGARKAATGALAALAGLTKFAPLALAPLLATDGLRGSTRAGRARALALFALAFALTAVLVLVPALTHSSLHTFLARTLVYQSERNSPFSVWGLYGLSPTGGYHARWLSYAEAVVQGLAVALAFALAILPRRSDLVGLAAACAAVLIAVQLGVEHWFYLYIPWFFGLAMLALLGALSSAAPEGEASVSARSSRLAAAQTP
jgi:Glycosyltransferase family 87